MLSETIDAPGLLPDGAVGIDAGLTLTKTVHATGRALACGARLTDPGDAVGSAWPDRYASIGLTGARAARLDAPEGAILIPELEAAARGASTLLALDGRPPDQPFLLALLGTGTAFAAIRDGAVTHLGGTALGGGSFAGIARRLAPALSHADLIATAARGDRRHVDTMVADAYPEGIGRVSAELTAAHLASAERGTLDDVLAALLNLHGENIGQIAASRARMAGVSRIVLCGGFVYRNPLLTASVASMCALFGAPAEAAPHAAWAGAVGATLLAVPAE